MMDEKEINKQLKEKTNALEYWLNQFKKISPNDFELSKKERDELADAYTTLKIEKGELKD